MTEFVNPYNFVPFEENGPLRPDSKTVEAYSKPSELISGWMDVVLEPKTILVVPDGKARASKERDARVLSDDDVKAHKYFRFFRLSQPDGMLAIPGSSLRGMIRSIYETASNSCLPFLLDDEDITIRIPTYASIKKQKMMPDGLWQHDDTNSEGVGLLAYDKGLHEWKLYEAISYSVDDPIYTDTKYVKVKDRDGQLVNVDVDVPENHRLGKVLINGKYMVGESRAVEYTCGQKVHFIPNGYMCTLTQDEKQEVGWLQFNKPVGLSAKKLKKDRYPAYHVRVLQPWKEIPLDSEARKGLYKEYKSVLESTNTKEAESLRQRLEEVKQKGEGMVPVWYLSVTRKVDGKETTLYYLSEGSISRVPQKRKWKHIMGSYSPCENTGEMCPACLLFGTTNGDARRGRVRFTDALPISKLKDTVWRELPILAQPRPSAYEFYLRKPASDATYWNYDFYSRGNRNSTEHVDIDPATPRGRKMYWHWNNEPQEMPESQKTEHNKHLYSTMEALEPDESNQFHFRVYFDRVTKDQLKQLKWVITLGDNSPDGNYCHKLGHGKPVGYGSVKLTVEQICIRKLQFNESGIRYLPQKTPQEQGKVDCPWGDKEGNLPVRIQALLRMADINFTKGKTVSYPHYRNSPDVFAWFAKNRMNANNLVTLPEPLDESLLLTVENAEGKLRTEENEPAAIYDGQVLEATVKSFNAGGSAFLILPGGERAFLSRSYSGEKPWNEQLNEGDKTMVKVKNYDADRKNYVVIPNNNNQRHERKSREIVCADCGKTWRLPFDPLPNRKYYCGSCRDKHKK